MRRFTTTVLFLALSTYVTCSLITDRVTKDIPMQDAELEENIVVPEVAPIDEVAQPNSITAENTQCAKIGEFCINHKDCCTNACLGFMRRCVSGKEFVED